VVADAGLVEPVSAPKFPANREINREFRQIRLLGAILHADTRANSKASSKIPYSAEQGIILAEQGILVQEQGIFPGKSEIITGSGFRYTQGFLHGSNLIRRRTPLVSIRLAAQTQKAKGKST
jgi:hypothetical protein